MEIPQKPRRKKLEVPIHDQNDTIRKTFSANFSSKKHKPKIANESPSPNETLNQKLSRKHLSKENAKLLKENEEIAMKFNELEELSIRKILKLKEKISNLQNINEEVTNENNFLKGQSQELLKTLDDFRVQLELSKHCKSCDDLKATLGKFQDDYTILQNKRRDLEEDINMLKTVVFRLNQQMERYQEKLRRFNIKDTPNAVLSQSQIIDTTVDDSDPKFLTQFHQDHTHTPISWGKVNIHTLGPLLDAYQDTITEKDEIIQNYERELSDFTGRLKEIIRENETLHKALTEDDECSGKLKNEVENLRRELKEVKDQNDMLIKKCALKQDKLDEILKCYEVKVDQLKRDYTVLHDQYYKSRTEVAALKEKNRALTDTQDEFKNERQNYIPLSVHTASVNECKKWYEELKNQYQQEKSKLSESIESQSKVIEDLQNKISQHIKEKEGMDNKIKQLEKHIKKGETKFLELEHTLSEVQFSRSACRKQLHKAMSFAKDLVAEQETLLKALNQRQLENKVVKKMGSDIASRMDSLKSQLKDVQRDAWQELSTVEKRIQKQNDVIETMKQEHNEEIERLQQIIKEHEENIKEQSLPVTQYSLFRGKHKNDV